MQVEITFFSRTIKQNVNVLVECPNPKELMVDVVWLFPGLGSQKENMISSPEFKQLIKKKNLFVIAVDGYRSFYQNMEYGYKYFDLISKEITEEIKALFKVEFKSESIIGISMGGYGALYHALSQPGRFKQVISISGSLNIVRRDQDKRKNADFIHEEWKLIFGEKLSDDKDLFKYDASLYPDQVILTCGEDDHLYNDNVLYFKHLKAIGVDVDFIKMSGSHEWNVFYGALKQMYERIGVR